jgi:hypothetical protein
MSDYRLWLAAIELDGFLAGHMYWCLLPEEKAPAGP